MKRGHLATDFRPGGVLLRTPAAASVERRPFEPSQTLHAPEYPHEFLLRRAWELRNNFTACDAMYVALAEALDAPLLTRDKRLVASPGHHARIELI